MYEHHSTNTSVRPLNRLSGKYTPDAAYIIAGCDHSAWFLVATQNFLKEFGYPVILCVCHLLVSHSFIILPVRTYRFILSKQPNIRFYSMNPHSQFSYCTTKRTCLNLLFLHLPWCFFDSTGSRSQWHTPLVPHFLCPPICSRQCPHCRAFPNEDARPHPSQETCAVGFLFGIASESGAAFLIAIAKSWQRLARTTPSRQKI